MGNGLSGAVDKLQVARGMKGDICFGMLRTTLSKISDSGIGTCPHSSTCIDRSQLFISLLFSHVWWILFHTGTLQLTVLLIFRR
ncbi:LOW QUALITY PROTEIN: hypothetical protein PanWU01x14_133490 [Parasponia andersonii]|uniref:Uncharacterized protein n=1 Tax=Parasponia andersonii TaxID=3476 RepID=A0A2P5CPU9_PARAD|nr:LOW QUALITY PROTEIN: hypothetical protein PanWU01x14_133490 [Parasponia andersonii]